MGSVTSTAQFVQLQPRSFLRVSDPECLFSKTDRNIKIMASTTVSRRTSEVLDETLPKAVPVAAGGSSRNSPVSDRRKSVSFAFRPRFSRSAVVPAKPGDSPQKKES